MHTRSHTTLPAFIVGNARADASAMLLQTSPRNVSDQARIRHHFYHQNIPAPLSIFKITQDQARSMANTCPNCQQHAFASVTAALNPRGLKTLQIGQSHITHQAPFGRLKYIPVSIHTDNAAVSAPAHAAEKSKDAIKRSFLAFSTFPVPQEIKTDHGPAYTSH